MKSFLVCVLYIVLGVNEGRAQEFEVSLNTSYIDTGTFNNRFSDRPNIEMTWVYDFEDSAYFETYAITGFERPFQDSSSEYGFEFGKSWTIGDQVSVNVATGRWMNYAGAGHNIGDWMVRLGLDLDSLSLGTTFLRGESDTVLFRAAYLVEMGEQLSFTPSLVYDTQGKFFNPGFYTEMSLSPICSLGLELVWAEGGDADRYFFSNLSLIFRW